MKLCDIPRLYSMLLALLTTLVPAHGVIDLMRLDEPNSQPSSKPNITLNEAPDVVNKVNTSNLTQIIDALYARSKANNTSFINKDKHNKESDSPPFVDLMNLEMDKLPKEPRDRTETKVKRKKLRSESSKKRSRVESAQETSRRRPEKDGTRRKPSLQDLVPESGMPGAEDYIISIPAEIASSATQQGGTHTFASLVSEKPRRGRERKPDDAKAKRRRKQRRRKERRNRRKPKHFSADTKPSKLGFGKPRSMVPKARRGDKDEAERTSHKQSEERIEKEPTNTNGSLTQAPGCTELRSTRYISNGWCRSVRPITEVLCSGDCEREKEQLPWMSKHSEWTCGEDVVKYRKVRLICYNNTVRSYKIKVVRSCACKQHMPSDKQYMPSDWPSRSHRTED